MPQMIPVISVPELSELWDWEKNDATPGNIGKSSNVKVHWQCKAGHSWQQSPNVVARSKNPCPYCDNRRAIAGISDFATLHPGIFHRVMATPEERERIGALHIRSSENITITCENGHRSTRSLSTTVRYHGSCPICSGMALSPGENSLAALHPEVALDWDHERNKELRINSPWEITARSSRAVFWRCHECGISVSTTIGNRVRIGCSYCATGAVGKKYFTPGVNDLGTMYPHLAERWDYTRNPRHLTPEGLPIKSRERIWLYCTTCGTSNERAAYLYEEKPSSCDCCSGAILMAGVNDFATRYPHLASQFIPENDLDLSTISQFWITTPYRWRCPRGHLTSASIPHRIRHPQCRKCSRFASYLEEDVYNFISTIYHGPIIIGDRGTVPGWEMDLHFPELNRCVEVNGIYWHGAGNTKRFAREPPAQYHERKEKAIGEHGISTAFLWEDDWRNHREASREALVAFLTTGERAASLRRLE